MPSNLTFETLDTAMWQLVGNDGTLGERLGQAIARIAPLGEGDFPPDCREEFKALAEKISQSERAQTVPEAELALAIYEFFKRYLSFRLAGKKEYRQVVI